MPKRIKDMTVAELLDAMHPEGFCKIAFEAQRDYLETNEVGFTVYVHDCAGMDVNFFKIGDEFPDPSDLKDRIKRKISHHQAIIMREEKTLAEIEEERNARSE